jgi:hypothetical protein
MSNMAVLGDVGKTNRRTKARNGPVVTLVTVRPMCDGGLAGLCGGQVAETSLLLLDGDVEVLEAVLPASLIGRVGVWEAEVAGVGHLTL